MQGNARPRIRIERAEEDLLRATGLSVCLSVYRYVCCCCCCWLRPRAISRISQYITEVAALGIILSALVAAASLRWMLLLLPLLRYREGEIRARARGPAAHCSRRFNRYSLSGLGSPSKTPNAVSPRSAPISGSCRQFTRRPFVRPLPSFPSRSSPFTLCED